MEFEREYGIATTIRVPMLISGSEDQAQSADWTPAAGDVKISKDGGAAANITTLPTAVAMGNGAYWSFPFSATEMQAASIVVTISDSATKAVRDQAFAIATYGDASAMHAFNRNVSSVAQSGDSFARIGATGSALTSLAQASVCTETRLSELDAANIPNDLIQIIAYVDALEVRLTAARALLLDNLGNLDAPITGLPSAVGIRTEIDANSTRLSAIQAKTDQLTFTIANVLDVNVRRINSVTIIGNGSTTPFTV